MKTIRITTWIAAVILTAGTALAQGGPGGRRGNGYGGPPQTDAQRTARQTQEQPAADGTCDGQGQGKGKGQGKGHRRGSRDGSGPRGGGGNCPAGN